MRRFPWVMECFLCTFLLCCFNRYARRARLAQGQRLIRQWSLLLRIQKGRSASDADLQILCLWRSDTPFLQRADWGHALVCGQVAFGVLHNPVSVLRLV